MDGAEFFANSEYLVYSIGSILAEGSVWDTKFPACAIPYDQMIQCNIRKKVNIDVAHVLDWSLRCCASGVFPTHGPEGQELTGWRRAKAGKPLCGGWRAIYFGFRSDMKAHKESNEFQRSYQHNFICERCYATKAHVHPALSFKNFHKDAPHTVTEVSPELRNKTCPLLRSLQAWLDVEVHVP